MRDRLSSLRSLRSMPGSNGELEGGEHYEESSPRASFSQRSRSSFSKRSHSSFSQASLEEEEEEEGEEMGAGVKENGGGGEGKREVEEVLEEALEARREIQQLRLDVRRLREQNSRIIGEPHSSQEIRRDSNAIGADIKDRGQGTLARLRKMDTHARQLEEEHGVNSAVARIARTQYACLSNNLRDAMMDYNEAEMSHRETCKAHIQRQMEIVGQDVDLQEVEGMLEGGQWNVFAQNLQSEGKTARSALGQIEKRHQDLLELESRIRSVHEVFLDVAMLVEEQGPMLNSIQVAVEKTEIATGDALVKIQTAKKHDKNNPLKKFMFWRR